MRFVGNLVSTLVLLGAFTVPAGAQAPAAPPISGPPQQMPTAPPISGPPQPMPTAAPKPTPIVDRDPWADSMTLYAQIKKVPKNKAIRISAKLARPNAVTPWNMEVVGEDAQFLYLKNLPIEDPASPMHEAWKYHEAAEAELSVIEENENKYFILDPFAELVPPPFTDKVRLEDRSSGLPASGKWQMGFAHADFNKDGREDLVFPPARMGTPYPTIFLGTEAGWKQWTDVRWPQTRFDYGDVGVADFDGDGNLDIVIANHFMRNYVLYGNGKGDFTRMVELPRVSPAVTSRALCVADFDGDGRPDVAFLSELDMQLGSNQAITGGLLYVCLNTKTGWQAVDASGGRANLFGDKLVAGDFDADGRPDLLISSHKNINRFLIYRNGGDGRTWTPVALDQFPFHAYVKAVAAGNLDRVPGDEAVMGFFQKIQSGSLGFPRNAIAIYSFLVGPEGLEMKQRTLVDVDAAETDSYTCATIGDVDGDGRPDLVLGRQRGGVRVFLQNASGVFEEERGGEIDLGTSYVNAVDVVNLTPQGPRAIIVASSDGEKSPGSIHCFVVQRPPLDSTKRRQ